MGTTATRRIVKLAAGLLAAGLVLVAPAGDPEPLGLVYDEVGDPPAALESVGRPVGAGEVLKALNVGALVRLDNGRLLRLAANSSARLDRSSGGDVRVLVLSGRVAVTDEEGRVHLAGQGSGFTLAPAYLDEEAHEERLLDVDLGRAVRRAREPMEASAGEVQGGIDRRP